MNIKSDARHYYLKGLLRQLKADPFNITTQQILYHKYRLPGWNKDEIKVLTRNEVIHDAISYIAELEAEVERLQYVARIIEAAREKENG